MEIKPPPAELTLPRKSDKIVRKKYGLSVEQARLVEYLYDRFTT
jgi:hypothetical protein